MKKFLIGLFSITLLAACSQGTGSNEAEAEDGDAEEQEEAEEVTAVSVLQNTEEAHNELQSAEVSINELDYHRIPIEGVISYEFTDGVTYFESERGDEKIYKDSEDIMLISNYSQTTNEDDLQERYIETKAREHKNPLAYYKEFDEDLYDKFELSERDAIYVLTYIGEEEDYELLAPGSGDLQIAYSAQFSGYEFGDLSGVETSVDSFRLSFDIDKDTHLIKGYELRASFEVDVDGFDRGFEADTTILYASANEELAIEKPEMDEMAVGDLTYEQQSQYEDEAFNYVDAVIQANIFQNIDEYVERAPVGSEEENREKGEAEQQSLLEEYAFALGSNMGEMGIDDEKLLELAAAMIGVYEESEYMIVDSKAISDDTLSVTVSIQGISQVDMEREVDLMLTEKLVNGDLTEESSGEDIANVLIEATERYKNENVKLNEARDVTVEVNRAGGEYMILDHSSYLDGFISFY